MFPNIYYILLKIALIIAAGGLWRKSGSGSDKYWRCIVLPILVAWYVTWRYMNWQLFLVVLALLQLTHMGYGIPDSSDKGSPVGRFWFRIFKNEYIASILTRGNMGLIYTIFVFILPVDIGLKFLYIYLNILIGAVGSVFKLYAEIYERIIGYGIMTIVFLI